MTIKSIDGRGFIGEGVTVNGPEEGVVMYGAATLRHNKLVCGCGGTIYALCAGSLACGMCGKRFRTEGSLIDPGGVRVVPESQCQTEPKP